MAFDVEGLLDFGGGALEGGIGAAKMSGGNPFVTAAGALGLGAISYFGGAPQRRLERKANKLSLKGMEQDLELGEFNLAAARRADKAEREAKKRKEMFGRLMGQYFQRKAGGA
jgi:hypothetical protein